MSVASAAAKPVGPVKGIGSMPLHRVSGGQHGDRTIVLGWTPPQYVGSYLFFMNGVQVSRDWAVNKNGDSKMTVQFSYAPGTAYEVVAYTSGPSGQYFA